MYDRGGKQKKGCLRFGYQQYIQYVMSLLTQKHFGTGEGREEGCKKRGATGSPTVSTKSGSLRLAFQKRGASRVGR